LDQQLGRELEQLSWRQQEHSPHKRVRIHKLALRDHMLALPHTLRRHHNCRNRLKDCIRRTIFRAGHRILKQEPNHIHSRSPLALLRNRCLRHRSFRRNVARWVGIIWKAIHRNDLQRSRNRHHNPLRLLHSRKLVLRNRKLVLRSPQVRHSMLCHNCFRI
jgi:hypothetical protein